MLQFRGQKFGMDKWTYTQKMRHCMKLQHELTDMYDLVNMMFITCDNKGLRLIMENPFSEEHYLRRYWCYPPSIIDRDRRERGDYFAKPTQYWFLNCEPEYNMLFEVTDYHGIECKDPIEMMNSKHIKDAMGKDISTKVARSMIHPDYANRFIREFIL